MSYVNCPNCNQKALSVATRCPRCGVAFESRLAERPTRPPRRLPLILVLAASAMGVMVVVNLVQRRVAGRAPMDVPPPTVRTAPPRPMPPAPIAAEAAESVRSVPAPAPRQSAPVAAAPARVPDSTPALAPETAPVRQRRYANTWVNVRAGRSPSAPVTRVLNPGDAVAVDLPELGWFRVRFDGDVLGYVDARFLDSTP